LEQKEEAEDEEEAKELLAREQAEARIPDLRAEERVQKDEQDEAEQNEGGEGEEEGEKQMQLEVEGLRSYEETKEQEAMEQALEEVEVAEREAKVEPPVVDEKNT
jgi:hypothetical protein